MISIFQGIANHQADRLNAHLAISGIGSDIDVAWKDGSIVRTIKGRVLHVSFDAKHNDRVVYLENLDPAKSGLSGWKVIPFLVAVKESGRQSGIVAYWKHLLIKERCRSLEKTLSAKVTSTNDDLIKGKWPGFWVEAQYDGQWVKAWYRADLNTMVPYSIDGRKSYYVNVMHYMGGIPVLQYVPCRHT